MKHTYLFQIIRAFFIESSIICLKININRQKVKIDTGAGNVVSGQGRVEIEELDF